MGTDALPFCDTAAAALVVVVARRALRVKRRIVDRSLPNGLAPLVLSLLAGLHGGGTPGQGFGDDVRDVLALQLIVGGDIGGNPYLGEAGEELVGETAAGHPVERLVTVVPVVEERQS